MSDVKKDNADMIGKLEHLDKQLTDLKTLGKHKEIRDVADSFLKVVDSLKQYQIGLHNYLRLHKTTELKILAMHTDVKVARVLLGRALDGVDDTGLATDIQTWITETEKLYAD